MATDQLTNHPPSSFPNVDGNFQLILIAMVTVDFLHGEFNPWRLYWTV